MSLYFKPQLGPRAAEPEKQREGTCPITKSNSSPLKALLVFDRDKGGLIGVFPIGASDREVAAIEKALKKLAGPSIVNFFRRVF